jgi:diphosphomevalonate decarboxylase
MSSSTEIKSKLTAGWESPSNIALVKYWGKHGIQLPNNASISFTLSQAATRTFVSLEKKISDKPIEVEFSFEGKPNVSFASKIVKFFSSIADDFSPFLKDYRIIIESSNSFPHSSGIASSASSMSALACCLCDLENQIKGKTSDDKTFFKKASIISRLGSGSAARSVFAHAAVWGQHDKVEGSSDEYATGVGSVLHPVFKTMQNDILIISADEKSVSSTAGHALMEGNPYAAVRYEQANHRLSKLLIALKEGDLETFGKITEDEALTLHALMMCSDPSYILMEEGSLAVIKRIKKFREEYNIPVYFTLDAGPNIHVLYPEKYDKEVSQFIITELKPYCHQGRIIRDKVGNGPSKIS